MIMLVILLLMISGIGYLGFTTWDNRLQAHNTKIPLVPTVAFPEAGVCQCGDALCYHDINGCSVPNCKCRMFVASTLLHGKETTEADEQKPYRLMLEAAKAADKVRY